MKKNRGITLVVLSLLFANCETRKETKSIIITETVPDNFQMYKTSEMAGLMRLMLVKNTVLRSRIIKGEALGDFDEAYLKIHAAKMTDVSQRDKTYPTFAKHFEQSQRAVFLVEKSKQKKHFNNVVNACVACHQDRCTGPIPRIKKLLIN